MAVTPPPGAGLADPAGRWRGRKAVRAATVLVTVTGLVITGVLAVVTFRGHQRTERALLGLQTTLIADAGEAEDQLYVEYHLGGAANLAAATGGDPVMFRQAMNAAVGGTNPFVTGSLWRLSGSSPQLVTEVGAKPLVPVTTALVRQAEASRPFFVTELQTPRSAHLAFAAAASGKDGTFIAYAEEPLPANRRITEPAGSPVGSLNLAVYLGRAQTDSALLETDSPAPLPLRGTTDTVRIPFGTTVLGVRAAAVMASLQFAGRAYAQEGYSPAMILERLSRSVDIERDNHFATVLCGLADVTAGTLVLASAGHLPPLILNGGDAHFAAIQPGPPVGTTGNVSLAETEVTMAAGTVLIAYTDGLVERRGEMLDMGMKRLQAAASRDSSSLDTLLSGVVTDLSDGTPTDDIALIGLKWLT